MSSTAYSVALERCLRKHPLEHSQYIAAEFCQWLVRSYDFKLCDLLRFPSGFTPNFRRQADLYSDVSTPIYRICIDADVLFCGTVLRFSKPASQGTAVTLNQRVL